jgi:S-(hydroxymethyl)glutathione dehydrogenase/alcohol dehydrogenase
MDVFKAAVLERINEPLSVKDVSLSEIQTGQVVVKVITSGLCGAQLQELAGLKGNANFVPHLLGHEGCGIVTQIGNGVTKVKPGDKVVMHWKKGDGFESSFPHYWMNDIKVGGGKVTTLSEYSIVSENRLTPVDKDTPAEFGALLGCGLSTALGTINYEANLKFGESILVLGSGGLGLNLIQASKLAGAFPIVSLDINNKEDLCKKLGATEFVSNVNELTSSFDVIVDTTGNSELIKNTIPLLKDRGRYIFVGQNKPGSSLELINSNHLFGSEGKIIKATQGGDINPSKDIKRYANLYKSGYIDIDSIITHRFSLDEVNQAFDLLKTGNAGRIIINVSQELL